jgi:hypothetical protein
MSTGFPAANAPALAAATAQLWLRDELAYAWRAAQNEAVAAYEARRPVAGAPPGRRPHTGARAGRPHRGPTWQGWSSPRTRSCCDWPRMA